MELLIGRAAGDPAVAMRLSELDGPGQVHGLSDGTWSLSDALEALVAWTGAADVTVATWTAGSADLRRAAAALLPGGARAVRRLARAKSGAEVDAASRAYERMRRLGEQSLAREVAAIVEEFVRPDQRAAVVQRLRGLGA